MPYAATKKQKAYVEWLGWNSNPYQCELYDAIWLDRIWAITMNVIILNVCYRNVDSKFVDSTNSSRLVTTIEKKPKLLKRPKSQTHPLSVEIPSLAFSFISLDECCRQPHQPYSSKPDDASTLWATTSNSRFVIDGCALNFFNILQHFSVDFLAFDWLLDSK